MLKFGKLFVSFAYLPLVLTNVDLDHILSIRFLFVLRLFDNCLTNCYLDGLSVEIRCSFFSEGRNTRATALFHVNWEGICLDPFTAIEALHWLTIFHHLFELFYSIVLLLQYFTSILHLFQSRRQIFVCL